MKKRYIFLIILLAIITIIGVIAYANRDLISAVYRGLTVTTEHLEKQKEETNKRADEAVKEYGIETIRPLTEEESEKLQKGELTEEEAINLVLGKKDSDTQDKPDKSTTVEPSELTPEQKAEAEKLEQANERISQLIGKMYVLKSQFTGEILNIKAWVLQEYRKLTPEEKKSQSLKMKIGKQAIAEASVLEAQCDGQVEEILAELTTLLQETGQSTTLVDQIRKAYEDEKQITKSYYISKI